MTEQYLLCDCTGTINELPLSKTVRRGDLQSSGLLDQKDAAVTKVLHSGFDLETNLQTQTKART